MVLRGQRPVRLGYFWNQEKNNFLLFIDNERIRRGVHKHWFMGTRQPLAQCGKQLFNSVSWWKKKFSKVGLGCVAAD